MGVMRMDAFMSADMAHRYRLDRVWDDSLPVLLWAMLNSSTADHIQNDPTITRVIDFSKRFGYGGAFILNLFAFRSGPRQTQEGRAMGIWQPKYGDVEQHDCRCERQERGRQTDNGCGLGHARQALGRRQAVSDVVQRQGSVPLPQDDQGWISGTSPVSAQDVRVAAIRF